MRTNTINLQIVRNLGNYESLRIGAEWTPDSNQTLADAMNAGLAELNDAADILTGKNTTPIIGGIVPNDATADFPKGEVVMSEEQAAKLREEVEAAEEQIAEQAAAGPQHDILDELNALREDDKRDLLTLANAKKFNDILGRLAAGVDVKKVFEHFRFGEDALAILSAAMNGERMTIAFGDSAFEALIKAIEANKDITNICNHILLADENTTNAWNLAIKMCNNQQ